MANVVTTATTTPTPARLLLLPILPLSLATVAAFALAIRSGWADLSQIWTRCALQQQQQQQPVPLCFAVSFFQIPLAASRRARLEQAAIVGLLAGLATVTAAEAFGARARRRGRGRGPEGAGGGGGDEKVGDGGGSGSGSSLSLSARIVENPAVPWLIYNLALGAFCWQAVIVPASIIQHHQSPQPRSDSHSRPRSADDEQQEGEDPDPAPAPSIPLSIALGLLVPSAVMLARPSSTAAVLAWLVFPLWISLAQRLPLPSSRRRLFPRLPLCAIPTLWSVAFHALLLADLLRVQLPLPLPLPADDNPQPSAVRSAMLLLEVDHAAIFATYLHWAFATSASRRAGARAVVLAVVSALLLGPGAGVCLGWWARCRRGGGGSGGGQQAGQRGAVKFGERREGRRRATGTFFAGPDA